MGSNDIREKYLRFFEKRGHARIPPSPLVLENDPTTLFTSAGMQQLVPYLEGKSHPDGKRLVDSQPCFRAVDIEEVGDTAHTTFFEMLGNWSLGDYFKAEQLPWVWEFFTKELGLSPEKLWVTVFGGTKDVPQDVESIAIWEKLGVPEGRIKTYGVDKNWWSITGTPDQMIPDDIGGPSSEVFYDFGIPHNPKFEKECHTNCLCGRFLEIGNSVFMQYKKNKDGSLSPLPQKNVDFGGGLERMMAATKDDPDVFKGDTFWPIIEAIQNVSGVAYLDAKTDYRIVTDHMKASIFLMAAGVIPSNKGHGYILRRLLRRAILKARNLHINELYFYEDVVRTIESIYGSIYLKNLEEPKAISLIGEEANKFSKVLDKGLKLVGKLSPFELFQTYGFPPDLMEEIYLEKGIEFDKKDFDRELEKHKELSRSSSSRMFKQK